MITVKNPVPSIPFRHHLNFHCLILLGNQSDSETESCLIHFVNYFGHHSRTLGNHFLLSVNYNQPGGFSPLFTDAKGYLLYSRGIYIVFI